MSEGQDKYDQDEELEGLLRRLVPTPLDVHQVSDLNRSRERVELERANSPAQMQWRRVIPLTLFCTVVMFGFALFRYGDRLREKAIPTDTAAASVPGKAVDGAALPDTRFVPVSTHGTIVNTSSGGVTESESGPLQRLNIEYRDAYHWHDPESGTNIRFFRPRSEEVIVPLQTD